MENIKICHVSMYYDPILGGQQAYIDNFIKMTKNFGFSNFVLQSTQENISNLINVRYTKYIWYTHIFKKFIFNIDWFLFNIQLPFYKKWLSSFDVIICHYPFHYKYLSWHPKVIILSHGVLWDKSNMSIFDRYHKKTIKKLNLKKHLLVSNDTDFIREIGYYIAPGTLFHKEIYSNIWFIPNGVDQDLFINVEKTNLEKIILLPRNIRFDRGIHLAIKAFALFHKLHSDFKLLIVGSKGGSLKYYNYCKQLVSDLNIENFVIFKGSVNHSDMIDFYRKATITLVPSISKEGTSLSAIESMLTGTPVISTNIGGLQDIPCIHVECDENKLSQAMDYLLENYRKESIEQQLNAKRYFNINIWSENWVNVINKYLKKNL